MNIKKIVIAIFISVLISAGLYYGVAAIHISDAITAILKDKFSLTMCVTIGSAFGILYLIYAIKQPMTEEELQKSKREYYYRTFTSEQKDKVNAMSETEKDAFYTRFDQKVGDSLNGYEKTKPSPTMKSVRKFALLGFAVFIVYIGYSTYDVVKEPYMAQIMAQNEERNRTYEDQVLNIEGVPPIRLVSEGTFKQIEIDKYIEENIKTQPAWLLAFATEIEIDRHDIYEKLGETDSVAFADSDTMSIHADFSQTQNWKEAISHELCHLFDFNFTDGDVYSSSAEFQALWEQTRGTFSFEDNQDYYDSQSAEFFAETGAMYITNPERLKLKNIDVYNYFNELFAPYQ